MKVLLIGGGGREHALGWKIAQSPQLSKLYLIPGNPGLSPLGETVSLDETDPVAITEFAKIQAIDLVVVGPEAVLATGLGDHLRAAGIACFGPGIEAAKLETSKSFMKEICAAAGAPTAAYGKFSDSPAAKAFLREQTPPFVIKADGLAAGKGVIIAQNLEEGDQAIDDILGGQFGDAGAHLIIEEFMDGEEVSFFAISDGETIIPMIAAQDHKKAYDGDEGPNTGGMGAYSPAPVFTQTVYDRTMSQIVEPIIAQIRKSDAPYIGVFYAGLMVKDEQPRLIEINVRFGDPECQIMMCRMKSDFLPILYAAATGKLAGQDINWSEDAAALVVMAANGYPGSYKKGTVINGIDDANALSGVTVFQAGTKHIDGKIVSNGGRVLNLTATGSDIKEAIDRAYAGIAKIDWLDGFYRRDIGWRALNRDNPKTSS